MLDPTYMSRYYHDPWARQAKEKSACVYFNYCCGNGSKAYAKALEISIERALTDSGLAFGNEFPSVHYFGACVSAIFNAPISEKQRSEAQNILCRAAQNFVNSTGFSNVSVSIPKVG